MTLTLNLPPQVEAKLREQAAATGRDAAQFASEIVEQAVSANGKGSNAEVSEAERKRLMAAFHELVGRAKCVVPDPNPPRLKGRKAEFEQAVIEKFRKQGLGA